METKALLTQAHKLLAAGQTLMALRVFEDIHARDPDQPEALNALALGALHDGQPARAIALLSSRLERDPTDVVARHHLARAQQAAGDAEGAKANWSRVLREQPDQYVARLMLAQLIEREGDPEAALAHYFRAISEAQKAGRWRSRESTPDSLIAAVAHAMRTVNIGRRQLYDGLLAPLHAQFGRNAMQRVDLCLSIYLGERRPQPADPRQQPTFLFFPGLPTAPFLDRKWVPELEALAARTPVILEELRGVMAAAQGYEAVFQTDALARANLASTQGEAPAWNGYYFDRAGESRAANRSACPRTASALDALPLSHVRGHGPETLFSVLSAGTHLLPHRGVTNTRIVGHLPLIVPPDCALRVADVEHRWKVGEPILFDDTYLHEAWNHSGEPRVVLIFDLWNPHLELVERLAVAQLVAAIGDFRSTSDRLPA